MFTFYFIFFLKITNNCPAVIYHPVSNISEPVSYNVTGLNPYTSYIVRVAAVNGVGEGHLANDSAKTKEESKVTI